MSQQIADDVNFPQLIAVGSEVSREYSVEITVSDSGRENRNANWSQARSEWNVSTGISTLEEFDELESLWYAVGGPLIGFRFQCPNDFTTTKYNNNPDDYPPGPFDQLMAVADGTSTSYQMVKMYGPAGTTIEYARIITRPQVGTVRIGLQAPGAVQPSESTEGWSVQSAGGLLTFSTVLEAGTKIFWGGHFDCPARFTDPKISWQYTDVINGTCTIAVQEVME